MPVSRRRHVLVVLREKLHWTQEGLARAVGVHQRTIQDVERGVRIISRQLAQDISQATRVSVEWLLRNDLTDPIRNVDETPYRGQMEVEQAKKDDSYLKEFGIEERAFTLSSRIILLTHYARFAGMLDALGNGPHVLNVLESKLNKAILAFIKDCKPARERWDGKAVKYTPFMWRLDKSALKRVEDDLRAVSEMMTEQKSESKSPTAEKTLIQFVMFGCENRAERIQAMRFIRARKLEELEETPLMEIRQQFDRWLRKNAEVQISKA
jgi:transcriptional regulator with XRE-family HTH domain